MTTMGCSRSFWRRQADEWTYGAIAEKNCDPRWNLPRIDVEPDQRSRFYDPYDPDEEPLPPDDPTAHEYMHCVAGMQGSNSWHEFGDVFSVENPHWLEPFGLTPEMTSSDGTYQGPLPEIRNLSLTQSLELSYIHSRDYQTAIEKLYLNALDLTFERFRFDIRFRGIGGRLPFADLTQETIPDNEKSLRLKSGLGISRLMPTGGQWAVELANNTLWVFGGGNKSSSASVLSYSLVQPLLRGAGRKVALESLTQSERNVLYEARNLARFRKTFFTNTVGGQRGFLGVLLARQAVINREGNVQRIEEQTELQRALASQKPDRFSQPLDVDFDSSKIPANLAEHLTYVEQTRMLSWRGELSEQQENQLRAFAETVGIQKGVSELIQQMRTETVTLSVAQLESQRASSYNALRSAQQVFQDTLDEFKLQLGLPPTMPITIDESLLEPFQLIDPRLITLENHLRDFVNQWAKLDDKAPSLVELRIVASDLQKHLAELNDVGISLVKSDLERVSLLLGEGDESNLTPAEIDAWRQLRERRFAAGVDRDRVVKDVANDRRLLAGITEDYDDLQSELKELLHAVAQETLPPKDLPDKVTQIGELREELLKVAQGLQVVQIGLRVELIVLEPFDVELPRAVAFATENRLDLMNERAKVMDARRAVEVAANALEAVVDVVVEGDVRTSGGNRPFDFRGSSSSFRSGLAFTAPLDQIDERNEYRRTLVEYQQARRGFMEFEDGVKLAVREDFRNLQLTRQNFETTRQAIRIAALQYDNAVEEATAPVQAGQSTRNQSLNLLNALRDVLNAQDDLIRFWVNYERSRLNIHRDMGIMEIDPQGVWVDRYYQSRLFSFPQDGAAPSDVPPGPDLSSEQHDDNPPSDSPAGRSKSQDTGIRSVQFDGSSTHRVQPASVSDAPNARQVGVATSGAGDHRRHWRSRLARPE